MMMGRMWPWRGPREGKPGGFSLGKGQDMGRSQLFCKGFAESTKCSVLLRIPQSGL